MGTDITSDLMKWSGLSMVTLAVFLLCGTIVILRELLAATASPVHH